MNSKSVVSRSRSWIFLILYSTTWCRRSDITMTVTWPELIFNAAKSQCSTNSVLNWTRPRNLTAPNPKPGQIGSNRTRNRTNPVWNTRCQSWHFPGKQFVNFRDYFQLWPELTGDLGLERGWNRRFTKVGTKNAKFNFIKNRKYQLAIFVVQ